MLANGGIPLVVCPAAITDAAKTEAQRSTRKMIFAFTYYLRLKRTAANLKADKGAEVNAIAE